jgi:hypothetical protein
VKNLGGFGGVEDKETTVWGVVLDMFDEAFIV